jgi:hypothetical protein
MPRDSAPRPCASFPTAVKMSRRGQPFGTSSGWLDVSSLVALIAVVSGSVMAVGAVHPPVLALVFVLALASASALVIDRGLGNERAIVFVLLALAGCSALQAVSLPASWVATIAPKNALVFAEALRPWRLAGPAHHAVSLDADATWIEVARLSTYAATVVLGARVVRAYGAVVVSGTVFAVALAVALVTLSHGILESRSLFGIYEPRYATPRWLSPLLNPNNLAGYLNLGLFCGAAVLTSRKTQKLRVPIVLGMAVLVAVSVLCGSRGAMLALLLGACTLVWVYRRKLWTWGWGHWLQLGGVAAISASLVAFAARSETLGAYRVTSTKLVLFGWVGRLIKDHPWLGVGRGAFESAFPPYRDASVAGTTSNVTFAHAENFVLQWAAEWGVPITLATIGVVGYALWRWSRRSRGSLFVATGIGVLLVQNLADVALEVPGVCIALFALTAVLFTSERRTAPDAVPGPSPRLKQAAFAGALVIVLISAWRLSHLDTVTEARDRLRRLYGESAFDQRASAETFDAALRAAVLERPGEPYFHLLGAMAARRARGEPNRWLSRALERDPTRAETYYVLGRVLAERGFVGQGLDAMRHALTQEPRISRKVARAAVEISHDPALLIRIAPDGETGCTALVEVASRLVKEEKRAFLTAGVARSPRCPALALLHAEAAVADVEANVPAKCQGAECTVAAQNALSAAERAGIRAEAARALHARLLAARDGAKAALAFLTGKCPPATEDLECTRLLLRFSSSAGASEDFLRLKKEFLGAACDEPPACVKAEQFVGDLAAQRGDWISALAHHERAARVGGGSAAWRRYSEVARKAGAQSRAADALQRAARPDHTTEPHEPPLDDDDDP